MVIITTLYRFRNVLFLWYLFNKNIWFVKGGFFVKIIFASTPGQEEKVMELVQDMYSVIFPRYFSDDEIKRFEQNKVLQPVQSNFAGFDTLRDAYKVITCLQTIISILEMIEPQIEYKCIFDKNASMLTEMGMYFPFEYNQFKNLRFMREDMLSIYSSAANQYLI